MTKTKKVENPFELFADKITSKKLKIITATVENVIDIASFRIKNTLMQTTELLHQIEKSNPRLGFGDTATDEAIAKYFAKKLMESPNGFDVEISKEIAEELYQYLHYQHLY